MLTNCGTLLNIPLLELVTPKYQTASVRGSTRGEGRDKCYASFCTQGNWGRGKIVIQRVNDRSRHKTGLSWLPAPTVRTLLPIWRDQAVKQHTTVSAPHFSFEREKQYLLNFIYSLFLTEFASFHAFSSCIREEKNLWRSLTAASLIST